MINRVNNNKKLTLPENSRRKGKIESEHWWDRQHSLVLRQTPRWAQSFTLGLIFLGTGTIIASSIIKIDEVITVVGALTPTSGVYDVMTPAGGLIKKVHVTEGDFVDKGTILIEFDTRRAEEEIRNLSKQLDESKKTYESGNRAMEAKKNSIQKSLETNKSILERMEELNEIGAYEENALLNQKDKVFQLETQILEVEEQLIQMQSNFERNSSDIKSRLNTNNIQKQYETVRAAKSGIVFDMQASTDGVMSGGEAIMKIVPQSNLKGTVNVTNKDIGFIKLGQKAQIRVDSFDFTRFGYIDGNITSIGADVKPPDATNESYRFPVTLTLEKNHLETNDVKIPLRSGMAITANLKLREKRLISVVNDLFNHNHDALTRLRQ